MKRVTIFFLAGMMTMGLVFCCDLYAESAPQKIKVVTTLFPFADWAGQIGGDRVEIVSLLGPGDSPHTYELTPRDLKAVQGAKLLIYNGTGLDDWAKKLVSADNDMITLAMAERLPLAPMPPMLVDDQHGHDHNHDHHHHHHDPTIAGCGMWLDPMRAVRMVDLIAEALGRIDPENRDDYQARAQRYWAQLDRLDRLYRTRLDPSRGGVICFHDAFIYLFRRYGVEIYGVVEPYPGKEPSVEYIRRLTALVADKPLQYVLTEPQLSEKPARVLADQLKVPLVTVDPFGGIGVPGRDSYISMMMYNLDQLTRDRKSEKP